MVSGEIKLEGIKEITSTRYEWSKFSTLEEIIFEFKDGRIFAISGEDGFFNELVVAILNKDTYISELGKVLDGEE